MRATTAEPHFGAARPVAEPPAVGPAAGPIEPSRPETVRGDVGRRLPTVTSRRRRRLIGRLGAGSLKLAGFTLVLMAAAGTVAAGIRGHIPLEPSALLAQANGLVMRLAGLAVAEILVEGRSRTDRDAVAEAIGARPGDPLLSFDANAARERLERIGWIESAVVERRLPDTIYVRLTERRPIALWQHEGRVQLIDAKGAVILPQATQAFAKLPVVVGPNAATQAEALLMMLATEPALANRVQAAVRVGDRRWNLIMDSGVEVKLPEDEADLAWARLAQAERDQKVLGRAIQTIDLRLPDRMLVRPGSPPPERLRPPARPT